MAGDKVDRKTGQAEMDGYLQNPNDWVWRGRVGCSTSNLD
jgi:hypothetical protein